MLAKHVDLISIQKAIFTQKNSKSILFDNIKGDSILFDNNKKQIITGENCQDFKDFVDAENLMPLPTSEFRNPVCLEMRNLRNETGIFNEMDIPMKPTIMTNNNNKGDMGSVDSSETFASCNTHPFNSQGDLTSEIVDPSCAIDSNLYVNPLDKSGDNSPTTLLPQRPGVKKSASGDTALRSLGTSPMDEGFREFGVLERGSRVSLNDSPLPKQRRTRFQHVCSSINLFL